MQSTGWVFRAASAVANGTTSLLITKPSGTVDNDIMLMWLTHKGADWAVMPAGWTLVGRGISGSTRGELHWRRASGEGANYSVTGLADTALGYIRSYIGGLLVGDIVDAALVTQNASGTRNADGITTTQRKTLLVVSTHVGANVTVGNQGTQVSTVFPSINFTPNLEGFDLHCGSLLLGTDTGTNNGTDCRITVSECCKIIPTLTGTIGVTQSFTGENVRIVAALIADETQVSAGMRYYFGNTPVVTRINEEVAGAWASSAYDPNILGNLAPTTLLSKTKTGGAKLFNSDFVTNRQNDYDILVGRFYTAPLDAQTISGTIDLLLQVTVRWLSSLGPTTDTDAFWKLHVYISEGQTGNVRHVLLDNHVDGTLLPKTATITWTGLSAPEALTAGACLAGDSVVVELGIRIASSPTPAPTYPPTEYSRITLRGMGPTSGGTTPTTALGVRDATAGTSTASLAGYIDFSGTIVEQALPASPTNVTSALATVLSPTLPLEFTFADVSQADANSRAVWFSWTPAASGNANLYLFGSNYLAGIRVLTGVSGSFVDEFPYDQNPQLFLQRSETYAGWDASMGTTYLIRIALSSQAVAEAGTLRFLMTMRDVVAQEDDLYIPNIDVFSWREVTPGSRLPINWSALNFTPSGCCIDYSERPMDDLNGGINTQERLYLGAFASDGLVEILDLPTLARDLFEVDFIFDATDTGVENQATLVVNPADGLLVIGYWGNGFLDVNDAGTTGDVAAWFDSVSDDPALSTVQRIDATHGDSQAGAPWPLAETFDPPVDATTAWYVAVSADGTILYYTSDGFYIPPRVTPAAFVIRRLDLTTGLPLADFATVAPSSSPLGGAGLHGIAIHSDGSVFVCNGNQVDWISSAGALIFSFIGTGVFSYDGMQFFDVKITADGARVVAIDEAANIFEWELLTGTQVAFTQTWMSQGNFTQFALYQPDALPPPPADCPGDRTGTFTDGLPYTPLTVAPCGGTGDRSGQQTGQ